MGVTQNIQNQISGIADGETFKYEHLTIGPREFDAAAKAIERLIAKGTIKRLANGVFYKPKKNIFGEMTPSEDELLKPYLFKNGERIAYITGTALYNQLGLTTQIPKSVKIASRDKRITVSRGSVKARPIKSYVEVTDKNFYSLELLDVLKDFKKIPDMNKESAIKILSKKAKELDPKETKLLIKCGLAYPPRVRAFLGALLEYINPSMDLSKLKNSLNPFSQYDYGIDKKQLSTVENWNIT